MAGNCTIVMYHYVRELDRSRYPNINARTVTEFQRQLDHLERHFTFVTVEDLLNAIYGEYSLPSDAVLLTFDDGLVDHYATVFPELYRRGIQGAFFPPAEPIRSDTVLDVHKIHFVLSTADADSIWDAVSDLVREYRSDYDLNSPETYYEELAESGRFDPPTVVCIKRLLQRELPPAVRSQIVDALFDSFVDVSEPVLSRELYMQPEQLQLMIDEGMFVGSHGTTHRWMGHLSESEQRTEIERSLAFLEELGAPTDDWIMCYPYGSYNETTRALLDKFNCKLGFTTVPETADVVAENAYTLARVDTNDIPH